MKTELKKTKVNKIISFIGWVWVAVWCFFKLAWPVVRWFFSFYLFFKLVSVFWLMGKPNAYPLLELFGVIFVYMFFDWLVRFYVPSPLKNLAGKNG